MEFGLYQHYKGRFYQMVELAKHSESLEEMVVYQALYGDFAMWVRPKSMFEEMVVLESGEKVPRFNFIYSEDDDENSDDEERELLTLFDNKEEIDRAVKILEKNSIECEASKERLDPKPKYLKTAFLYKLFVREDDFEAAMDALK